MTRDAEISAAVRLSILEILSSVSAEAVRGPARLVDDLGANSIDQADIIEATMDRLSLEIPMLAFSQVRSVQDLEDVLRKHLGPTP